MKKSMIVLAIVLMMTLFSCGNSHSDYSEIYESFSDIENYYATVSVTVIGNEGENKYKARQYYASPDLYRMDFVSEGMENWPFS